VALHPVVPLLLAALVAVPAAAQTPAPAPEPSTPTIRLSGYLQARETWQEQIGLASSINRARLGATGAVAPPVTYRLQAEFRTGSVGTGRASVSLTDAYVRFARSRWAVQAGQFKTPFASEYLTSLADVETADRAAAVDSLAPKRDIGVMGEYAAGKVVTAYAGVFNGEGTNLTTNADSIVLGVVRVALRPVLHLTLGLNGARYFGDSTRYGVDAAYADEQFVLRGEYLGQSRDLAGAADDTGWYVVGACAVVPALQFVSRYEEFERPGVSGQSKIRAWSLGANIRPLGPSTRFTLEYLSRRTGDPGVRRGRLLAQAQVKY
jgi:phosphate-selective porin